MKNEKLREECPKCGSKDFTEEYLFPRENFEDKSYECNECGHHWDDFDDGLKNKDDNKKT
jgi:uncharacterized Zn finger protein